MSTEELKYAKDILESVINCSLTSVTSAFMLPPLPLPKKQKRYDIIVTEPICLKEMEYNIINNVYQSITEFICDFRLMLFNGYRYYGCESRIGQCALKLEIMFEQKLLSLPSELRSMTSMNGIFNDNATSEGIPLVSIQRRSSDRFSNIIRTPIYSIISDTEKLRKVSPMILPSIFQFHKDPIKYLTVNLCKWKEIRYERKMTELLYSGKDMVADNRVLDTSPEFVEVLQFLNVGYSVLGLEKLLLDKCNLTQLTNDDFRHGVLFPRTSQIMAAIVAVTLTRGQKRQQVIRDPLPSYEQWNKALSERVLSYYYDWKRLHDRSIFVRRYSIDPVLFDVLGQNRPNIEFNDLSVFQRCHVLLALCHQAMKLQDKIHWGIDETVDWDEHRRIVLSKVGGYEYVRFSGLSGCCSSYHVYRMKALEMDEELRKYNVQDKVSRKRPVAKMPRDKYRVPVWHETTECSQGTRPRKYSSNRGSNRGRTTDSMPDVVTTLPNNGDVENDAVDYISHDMLDTEDVLDEYEEPTIRGPIDGDFELLVQDLAGLTRLLSDVSTTIELSRADDEDLEGYKTLMEALQEVQVHFKNNEVRRKRETFESRLRVIGEMKGCKEYNWNDVVGLNKWKPEIAELVQNGVNNNDEKSASDDDNERYTESELRELTGTKTSGQRIEVRNEKRLKEENIEDGRRISQRIMDNGDRRAKRKREDDNEDGRRMSQRIMDNGDRRAKRQKEDDNEDGRRMSQRIMNNGDQRAKRQSEDDNEDVRIMSQMTVINGDLSTKRQNGSCTTKVEEDIDQESENHAPGVKSLTVAATMEVKKTKKKVFHILNDFFTDDVLPVRLNNDGSLEPLPIDSVTKETYAMAKNKIETYKRDCIKMSHDQ